MAQPSGILIPGGGPGTILAMGDENLLRYVRSAAEGAQLVASVGTGALLLAAAGLLDGRQATTHQAYRGILENLGATYVQRRWTTDGKFVTSGGTSGGVDMGLHLVGEHKSEGAARQVQLWVEYDPQPPFGNLEWGDRSDDAPTPVLTQHKAEWQRRLAHRPDLLEAIQRATTPAVDAGIKQK
jgi:transcriptional regulator GlxA family with amidase domain